jgi:hypothetical protein
MDIGVENVRAFIEWWACRRGNPPIDMLDPGFVYDSGIMVQSRDDFLAYVGVTAAMTQLQIHGILVDKSTAMTFFAGWDPVTNLRHRIAWFIEFSGGHIVRLLSVTGVWNDT